MTLLKNGVADTYVRNGFVVVRNAIEHGVVNAARDAVDRLLAATASEWNGDRRGYRAALLQFHQARLLDPSLDALARDEDLAALARDVTGAPVLRLFLDQIVCKLPGAAPTIAHQDAPFLAYDDRRSANCWIALDDTEERNGALEYYVGSHNLGLLGLVHLDRDDDLSDRVPALRSLRTERVELCAGDAVFHHAVRRALSIQYMPADAVFNGWWHDFLRPYEPAIGHQLTFDCCPIVGTLEQDGNE
jgi:ectoine hydroxylase-related dioxygenase (phytanoyl-CoA dioxygenase family)